MNRTNADPAGHPVAPWEKVESRQLGDYRVFHVRQDRARSPQTGQAHTFYVIDAPDWVNIIPITPEGKIVCVRQYRHGIEAMSLEVPGGIIDPEDASPAAAARREMVEETGYDTDRIITLGTVTPNPAIQNNRCHSYLALHAQKTTAPSLEDAEEIELAFIDPAEAGDLIASGRISHALVVAAFYLFDRYRRLHPDLLPPSGR